MPTLINKILHLGKKSQNINGLESYDSTAYQHNGTVSAIGPFSNVNLLVGANNSGKSRFMRSLLKSTNYVVFENAATYSNFLFAIDKIQELASKLKIYSELIFSMANVNYPNKENLEFINASHRHLHESNVQHLFSGGNNNSSYVINKNNLKAIEDELNNSVIIQSGANRIDFDKIKNYAAVFLLASVVTDRRSGSDWNHWPQTISTINYKSSGFYGEEGNLLKEIGTALNSLGSGIENISPTSKIYIPILRTARTLLPVVYADDSAFTVADRKKLNLIFINTIASSYGIDTNQVEIHTGLDLYSKINKNRNDSRENRILFDKFEDFISKNFFQGKDFEIVARYAEVGEDEHLHISINNTEYEIHFLGDGIQALITLLYPIFLAKSEAWVFIEEPEIHLHPGMQRLFIETLLNDPTIKEKNLTIFMTTHSNHLFDIAVENQINISIMSFQKIQEQPPRFLLNPTTAGELQILNLLEVSNSSVFMANCAIWVEGPTDRIYLRKYLDEYLKHNHPGLSVHEDLEYCFFEYAGSNLSHYVFSKDPEELDGNEIKRINAWFLANRIFLVADTDSGKDKKHSSLLKQQNDNFVYYQLPVREVENLLTPRVIEEQMPKIFGKWGKSKLTAWHNAIAAKGITAKDYKDEYLAAFLISAYPSIKFPDAFSAASGTLNSRYKVKLAQRIDAELTWADMSKDARQLAAKIFEFIKIHNPLLSKVIEQRR